MKRQNYLSLALLMLGVVSTSLVAMDAQKKRDLARFQRESLIKKLATVDDDAEQESILKRLDELHEQFPDLDEDAVQPSVDADGAGHTDGPATSDEESVQSTSALLASLEKQQKERKQQEAEAERLRSTKQDYDRIYRKPFRPKNDQADDRATVESQLAELKELHAKFAADTFEFQYTRMLMARCRAVLNPTDNALFGQFMQELQKIDKMRFVKTQTNPEGLVNIENEVLMTVSHMTHTAHAQRCVPALRALFAQRFSDEGHAEWLEKINGKINERLQAISDRRRQRHEQKAEDEEENRKVAEALAKEDGDLGADAKRAHDDHMRHGDDQDADLQRALDASLTDLESRFGTRSDDEQNRKSADALLHGVDDPLLAIALAESQEKVDDEEEAVQQALVASLQQKTMRPADAQNRNNNALLQNPVVQAPVPATQAANPAARTQRQNQSSLSPSTAQQPSWWRNRWVLGGAAAAVGGVTVYLLTKKPQGGASNR